jgi:hypothetical protein
VSKGTERGAGPGSAGASRAGCGAPPQRTFHQARRHGDRGRESSRWRGRQSPAREARALPTRARHRALTARACKEINHQWPVSGCFASEDDIRESRISSSAGGARSSVSARVWSRTGSRGSLRFSLRQVTSAVSQMKLNSVGGVFDPEEAYFAKYASKACQDCLTQCTSAVSRMKVNTSARFSLG